jgi:DnaJ-class molecular chaperone
MKHIPTLHEAAAMAKVEFKLDLPVTLDVLKGALRLQLNTWHPDRHPEADRERATEVFRHKMDTYEQIVRCPQAFQESAVYEITHRTVDGRLLSDLGTGLGPLVNASDCGMCGAKGYVVTFEQETVPCTECDAVGRPLESCRDCRGSGKFALRSKRVVDCRRCQGTGKVSMKSNTSRWSLYDYLNICSYCSGSKRRVVDNKLRPVYHTCTTCNGSGAIRIFNPVIRRGAIGGSKKSQKEKKKCDAKHGPSFSLSSI